MGIVGVEPWLQKRFDRRGGGQERPLPGNRVAFEGSNPTNPAVTRFDPGLRSFYVAALPGNAVDFAFRLDGVLHTLESGESMADVTHEPGQVVLRTFEAVTANVSWRFAGRR